MTISARKRRLSAKSLSEVAQYSLQSLQPALLVTHLAHVPRRRVISSLLNANCPRLSQITHARATLVVKIHRGPSIRARKCFRLKSPKSRAYRVSTPHISPRINYSSFEQSWFRDWAINLMKAIEEANWHNAQISVRVVTFPGTLAASSTGGFRGSDFGQGFMRRAPLSHVEFFAFLANWRRCCARQGTKRAERNEEISCHGPCTHSTNLASTPNLFHPFACRFSLIVSREILKQEKAGLLIVVNQ